MADETTPQAAPPPPDSIQIPTEEPSASPQSIPIDLNPEYDPAKDKRAPFLKQPLHPTGPTISPAPEPGLLERAKKVVTEGIPQFSTRTVENPKYGQEQFLAPEEALTPDEQRAAPVATGALEAAGGLTSPATVATIAGTAGLGEAGVIPKVLSGLFAGQIATSIYDQYPALKAAVDKAQHAKTKEEHDDAFADAQRLLTHMGANTVMGLLAAEHGAEGAKEILDATTGSGVPDQASTFKSPGAAPAPIEPEELHPEMNRDTVKKLQDLGYSNQHITNFNISEIRDILKNQTPAAEYKPAAPAAPPAPAPEPDKFASVGGKLVAPAPKAEVAAPEIKISTDNTGIKWAENADGIKVSVPKKIPEAEVQTYAAQKIAEQVSMQAKTKAFTPTTNPVEDLLMADKIGAKKVSGVKTSSGTLATPDTFASVGGKFIGEQPTGPSAYHPALQKIAGNYGLSNDASKVTKGGSFITPDGKFIHLPAGTQHPDAIAEAIPGAGGDNRSMFIGDTGAIRTRFSLDRSGPTLHVSVPETGVTSDQIEALKQAVGQGIGRNGNMVLENAPNKIRDINSATKEFVRPSDVEPMLKEVGAHPDQQEPADIISKELQTPHKETYGMEIQDERGGKTKIIQVDAHSPKKALAEAVKKFPDAYGWRLSNMPEEKAPSTEYSIPTGKIQRMKNDLQPVVNTVRHELGHAIVALDYGLKTGGMISSSHPSAPGDMRAGVLISGQGLYERGPNGKAVLREAKRLPVLKQAMAGIAADEVFNDIPRSANHNFSLTRGSNDAKMAFDILTEAGFNSVDAVKEMHRMIDENVEFLSRPHVSAVIQENENFREPGLSRQFHYSPDRLQNMHAEIRKRIANEKTAGTPEGSNVPTSAAVAAGGGQADVSGTEGGVSKATPAEPAEAEEGIVSADKIKKSAELKRVASLLTKPDGKKFPSFVFPDGRIIDDNEGLLHEEIAARAKSGQVSDFLRKTGGVRLSYGDAERMGVPRSEGDNFIGVEVTSNPNPEQRRQIADAVKRSGAHILWSIEDAPGEGSIGDFQRALDKAYPEEGIVSEENLAPFKTLGPTGVHTLENSKKLVRQLEKSSPGAEFEIVGGVAAQGRSERDLDLLVHSDTDEPNGVYDHKKTAAALEKLGFEQNGSFTVSPEEAAASNKKLAKGWSHIEVYQNFKTRHTVELWFPEGENDNLLFGEKIKKAPKPVPEVAPNEKLQASAQRYAAAHDMPEINHEPVEADPERAKEIAKIYDEAKHDPNDPRVKAAYAALKSETLAQFHHLRDDLGLKFKPQEEDPYPSAEAMMDDIRKKNQLKVFTGSSTGEDHPLSAIAPSTGGETYNTVFRWVHDAMGHAAGGNDFSESGEKSATEAHAQMYSDTARPAMRAETEGQTSWFFHNPDIESGKAQPGKFAEQKATILPDVSPNWHETAGEMADQDEAGGINPRTGKSDTKGMATEILPEMRQPLDHSPTAQDFKNFYEQHKDIFDKYPELRVGWDNKSAVEGGHEINIGAVGPHAARVAQKLDQKSAFDIAKGEIVPTGGTGLRTTFRDYPLEQRIKDLKGENDHTVSTRVPTGTVKGKVVEDHTDQSRMSDMDAAKVLARPSKVSASRQAKNDAMVQGLIGLIKSGKK